MRRRSFFTLGAAGVGAAVVGGAPQASAEPVLPPPGTDPLEQALFNPATPVRLPGLPAALARARSDFRAARYDQLRATLPAILSGAEAERDAASGQRREKAHAVLARAHVLATELAVKDSADYAWVTADRALTAARASGSSIVVGEAARVLAITMRRSGRITSAVQLLTSVADLDSATTADALAVRTSLLLTAAYTAATGGDWTAAYDLVEEAERTALRAPAGMTGDLFTVEATAEQCTLYRIGIATALGNPDAGVKHALALDPTRLPTRERRARYFTDTARMWDALGEDQRTYEALLGMERVAPQEVRRPSVRTITARLVHSPARLPGLRPFAARTGAIGT
ncbi:XRE family transcriptional regulator [Kitasatospora sp. NPDC127111]|uniref:XRE family transcriptional regulator n=1 Tax=Kitasatospora sp. NPDC127111 TaxID=3345363 RepID=UPI003631173A